MIPHSHLALLNGEGDPGRPSPFRRPNLDRTLDRLRDKHREAPAPGEILAEREAAAQTPVEAAILRVLPLALGATWREIAAAVPHGHGPTYHALQQLVIRGAAVRLGRGTHGSPFRYLRR